MLGLWLAPQRPLDLTYGDDEVMLKVALGVIFEVFLYLRFYLGIAMKFCTHIDVYLYNFHSEFETPEFSRKDFIQIFPQN